jgi:peptidoglycan/xylan/chitin deacetylase (PgdA/CDA1 family)
MNNNTNTKYGYLALCYHYIRPDADDPFPRILGTKTSEFKDQIKMLRKNFQMISLDDVLNLSYKKSKLNNEKNSMLITFDDGLSDHFNAAKILHENEVKGTFFIPTCILKEKLPANPMIIHYSIALCGLEKFLSAFRDALKFYNQSENDFNLSYEQQKDDVWKKIDEIKSIFKYKLDYQLSRKLLLHIYQNLLLSVFPEILKKIHLDKEQIKEMVEMGHSIGVHTHTHISVAATNLSKNDFNTEIIFPKKYLENEFKTPVYSFSYPFGEQKDYLSSMKLLDKTKEYKLAFTVEEIINSDNTSPLEIGRYQPHSNDNVITLQNTLSNIIKKCDL